MPSLPYQQRVWALSRSGWIVPWNYFQSAPAAAPQTADIAPMLFKTRKEARVWLQRAKTTLSHVRVIPVDITITTKDQP